MAWNPKLKIDLIQVFNRVYGSKPYEVRRALRQIINTSSFKDDFGLAAIDLIVERTLEGQDKNGKAFKRYSKAYKKSAVFEIYGKGSHVDLKLSGEMLASMQTKFSGTEVVINFVDELNAAKAHGHITGMNGRKGGVVRNFFGLNNEELDSIMKATVKEHTSGSDLAEMGRELIREIG